MNFWRWLWLVLMLAGLAGARAHFQNLPPEARWDAGLMAISGLVAGVGAGSFLWDLVLTSEFLHAFPSERRKGRR